MTWGSCVCDPLEIILPASHGHDWGLVLLNGSPLTTRLHAGICWTSWTSFLMFLIKHYEAKEIYPSKFLTHNLFAFHLYGFEFLNFIMSFRGLLSPTFTYLFTYIGQNSKIFLAMCFLFSAEAIPMWLVKFLNLCSLWTGLDWFMLYNRSLSKLSFLCFPQYKYCVQLSPT